MKHLFSLSLMLLFFALNSMAIEKEWKIVQFDIKEDIAPSATRLVQKGLDQARLENADLVIIHMNTFGGLLTDADSIRTAILNAPFPVYVFIDKNAASAGALISIACDKIFMAPGASIGSATVVDGEGNVLPDKYQSYMRSIMRATAESHGKDTIISGNDTTYTFKRDPMIAEGMVDPRTVVPGVIDSSKVIAFTPQEAIKFGYCEAEVKSIEDLLKHEGITNYTINKIEKTSLDKVIGFLSSPVLSGVLIMLIFWGIFFELRTPGIGFPLAAAVVCALLYFAPLYLEGLAANWEILLFFVGIILIGLEIFVIPGFGVAGISGIVLTISSLVLSMVRNINFDFTFTESGELVKALSIVLFALGGFVVGSLLMGKGLMNTPMFKRLVLSDTLQNAKANPTQDFSKMSDEHFATAHTDLRPMGKIRLGGEIFEAKTLGEFISEGEKVAIIGKEMNSYLVARTSTAIA